MLGNVQAHINFLLFLIIFSLFISFKQGQPSHSMNDFAETLHTDRKQQKELQCASHITT